MSERPVYVLGAGVVGLTTATVLRGRGHRVIVAADRFSPHTTSDVAAAVWFPYAVSPRSLALTWARTAFLRFKALAVSAPSVVSMVEFRELFTERVGDPWWGAAVDAYRFLTADELPPGYVSGYAAEVPVIESTPYLQHLRVGLEAAGVEFVRLDAPATSFDAIDADVVVNCCGLGAATLCADAKLYPIRGQVLRVSKNAVTRSFADDAHDAAPTYIVPRQNDCILGGTATVGDADLAPREADSASILARCGGLAPEVAASTVLETKVGLRPGRDAVRLERERVGDKTVIHNYGHGGAGFTLSWGCAESVADFLEGLK